MTHARTIRQEVASGLIAAALVILLGAGPTLNMSDYPYGAGLAAAALRGGGGGDAGRSGRGGGGARAGQNRSKVDRQPRASSAKQGSIERANMKPAKKATREAAAVKRPADAGTRDQRLAKQAPSQLKRPAAKTQKSDRSMSRNEWNKKLQSNEGPRPGTKTDRKAARQDSTQKLGDRRSNTEQSREDRKKNVEDRRKEYTANRDEIRDERKKSMEELQKNRQDYLDAAREDRQDFAQDMMKQREDMWEDIYDDRHYWGDYDDHHHHHDDDDDEWLWGIGGALVGGVAGYMIGAAVNSPPEGTVTVPAGGTNYQYYGGAFYQPAPSGEGYVTAPAPVGATVEAPPLDCTIVFGPDPADPGYCFFQGAFFLYDEGSDSYLVAEPPMGTQVPYLPEGYTEETVNGVDYYKLGTIYYRPYLAGDDELFVVSKI
jgi:hypothetical protein